MLNIIIGYIDKRTRLGNFKFSLLWPNTKKMRVFFRKAKSWYQEFQFILYHYSNVNKTEIDSGGVHFWVSFWFHISIMPPIYQMLFTMTFYYTIIIQLFCDVIFRARVANETYIVLKHPTTYTSPSTNTSHPPPCCSTTSNCITDSKRSPTTQSSFSISSWGFNELT